MPFVKRRGREAAEGGRRCRCGIRQSLRQHHIILLCLRVGGADLTVGRCSILQGGRRQGFLDKYARLPRKIYRETAVPPDLTDDRKPCMTFAPADA